MSKQSGMGGREIKTDEEPPGVLRVPPKADRPGNLLPQLVHELLALAEEALPPGPDPRRVRLRNLRGRMRAVWPRLFRVSDTDLAWEMDEEAAMDVYDGR